MSNGLEFIKKLFDLMKAEEITQQMTVINDKLRYHSQKYHQEDNPEISDFEYDLLFNELRNLEEAHPDLILMNSIIREVGFKIKKGFQPFTHPVLMGSLDNAMTLDEVENFIQRRNKDLGETVKEYYLSLKLDGLALELIYQNGKLSAAATRGDGMVGENITKNAVQVGNIPLDLCQPYPPLLIIRGEVVMTKRLFEELNQKMEAKDESPFANPRNAAAGTMRQLDPAIVKDRKLFFYPYAISNWEDCFTLSSNLPSLPLETHSGQMDYIEKLGFTLNPHAQIVRNFLEIKKFCENIIQQRHNLDYEIDGVVIKINSGSQQNTLGNVGRRPRYAIAWKLPPEIKKTIIEDVVFQVGRTGKITPVAILKPVQLGGVQIRRATLHNFNEIREKDIRIQDTVEVIRSGDVIPKILKVDLEARTLLSREVVFPSNCPICSSPIEAEENGLLSFCRNQDCPSKQYHNIVHFASKNAFDIEGLGKEIIQELIQNGKLKDVSDIFLLQDNDLDVMKRVGNKFKSNLLGAIQTASNIPLSKFIYSLGIPTVGEKTAKILARKFQTLDNLMGQARESLLEIDEIGEITAGNIYEFFSSSLNRKLIKKIIGAGVIVQAFREDGNKKKLLNKKILFTGTLSLPRRRAKELAENAGADIVSSVSRNLDYLVVGENPGSKKKIAEEFHIKIIREEDFLKLISD